MHPDLALLVELQRIESAIDAARKALGDLPAREAAVDAALAAATARHDEALARVAENQAARRTIERDLAQVQARLERFKSQTMAVKTNKEFHALQHEIAVAQEEIQRHEDTLLECLVRADELAAAVKAAERAREAARQTAEAERADLRARGQQLEAEVTAREADRRALVARVPRQWLALFESVRQRGVAVAEVRDGHCGVCHVRLRPQTAQAVVRGESIIQCDSCGRILHAPATTGSLSA